ncbi:MAG: patatin-like phospholipase family protein [Thermoanaerobaculia bacterium]|nr:patatin-like phospholipase family protein [Thermoanaerobaculia bacterium]
MADDPGNRNRDPSLRTFDEIWEEELATLAELRELRGVQAPAFDGESPRERAYSGQCSGLCFSGGGIRSATFNLGVAQALAERGLLRRMDYLSTVSGGGYIGSWLTAWIRNQGFDAVEDRLPVEHTDTPQPPGKELATSPVTFLRSFSSYLIPRLGTFSADTWAAVATYVRNLILNQVVLISGLAAVLLVPRFLVQISGWLHQAVGDQALAFLGLGLLLVAITGMGANVIAIEAHREREHPWYARQIWIQLLVAVPLFLAGWLIANAFWFGDVGSTGPPLLTWMIANAFVYSAIWLLVWAFLKLGKRGVKKPRSHWGWLLGTAPLAGAVGGLLYWLVVAGFVTGRSRFFPAEVGQPWSLIHATVLGAPAIVLVFILTAVLHIGLMGRSFDEANREWWSRLGGWLMIYGITWLGFTGMTFYAPIVIIWLGGMAAAALGAGWLGSSIGGILFERKTRGSDSGGEHSGALSMVRALVPQIFVVGLIAILAFGLHLALNGRHSGAEIAQVETKQKDRHGRATLAPEPPAAEACDAFWHPAKLVDDSPNPEASIVNLTRCHSARSWVTMIGGTRPQEGELSPDRPPTSWLIFVLLVVLGAGSVLLSWRIDINQFSMHLFYRNRLIRAYLGASNPSRQPQAFTGFDPDDDFALAELLPDGPTGYDGPFHLINGTLNLVKGQELAWQQRKGASFVFTPLHTGFGGAADTPAERTGFRNTREYETGSDGISLGMAMAISGAAVSPNMGQKTTAAMAFLLTVFDARLGWWLGNPLKKAPVWRRTGPDVGIFRLLAELFGSTSVRSNYVYLSDGGHFDNMGLYELVRRRCRFIIASDGGADTGRTFAGLANALRKCRNDFGVPITVDLSRFCFGEGERFSKVHCAVGKIHYDAVDPGAPKGTLLFLKTTLTGDEPADVLNYQSAYPEFPNQSTADQFFDEAQFESYRALGHHTVDAVFENLDPDQIRQLSHAELCATLENAWCRHEEKDEDA